MMENRNGLVVDTQVTEAKGTRNGARVETGDFGRRQRGMKPKTSSTPLLGVRISKEAGEEGNVANGFKDT